MDTHPFDPTANRANAMTAAGHRLRTGHELTGYYILDPNKGGISTLVRTCACANPDAPRPVNPYFDTPTPTV